MSEKKILKIHAIIGDETLKQLPITMKLLNPKPAGAADKDTPSLKITKNAFYKDERYGCYLFHKPISKML